MDRRIIVVVVVVVAVAGAAAYLLMNRNKNNTPPQCTTSSECVNGGTCSSGNCVCTGNFDPATKCATCKSGFSCPLTVTFYSGINYTGTAEERTIQSSAIDTYFPTNTSSCTAVPGVTGATIQTKLPFKPLSIKLPTGYSYCIVGSYANPGDTACGPTSTCYAQDGQWTYPNAGNDCFANIYSGVSGSYVQTCANSWISANSSSGFIRVTKATPPS